MGHRARHLLLITARHNITLLATTIYHTMFLIFWGAFPVQQTCAFAAACAHVPAVRRHATYIPWPLYIGSAGGSLYLFSSSNASSGSSSDSSSESEAATVVATVVAVWSSSHSSDCSRDVTLSLLSSCFPFCIP